jgi:hypothetical protein
MLERLLHPCRPHAPEPNGESATELHESITVAHEARRAAEIYISWLERALSPATYLKRDDDTPIHKHRPEVK